jgi:hypothetical protein
MYGNIVVVLCNQAGEISGVCNAIPVIGAMRDESQEADWWFFN